jgi:virulence-associated protein VagC
LAKKGKLMRIVQSILNWAALIFIIALTGMSIYSAFIGPYLSGIFFSCAPLSVYWLALTILLLSTIIALPKLVLKQGLLLIHLGCILILTGAMAGSKKGQLLTEKIFGSKKITTGEMLVSKQQPQDNVLPENNKQPFRLPFSIKLKELRVDFYKSGRLFVQTPQKQTWELPVRAGNKFTLDPNVGTLKILKVYRNFRIKTKGEKQLAYDSNGSGSNPAVLIEYKTPKGSVVDKYIFARFPNPVFEDDKIFVEYVPNIKQISSDVEIIKDDQTIKTAVIKVNRPLHFGGYHFYQYNYDAAAGQFTVLGVVSDTGLYIVYAGYALLCAGIFWHFWLRHLHRKKFNSMN